MPKFRKKLMIQFQENTWTDGRTRRTERPYFIGPFWLLPGIQNGLKTKKIKLPQMKFLLKNTNIFKFQQIFMYLSVPFILQNF